MLSPLRDRNDEVVYLIGTTQPRFLDPDSPELQPAPSHGPGVGHVLGHSASAEGGVQHPERQMSPLSPALPPPRLTDARASELLPAATAAAAVAASVAAAAAAAAAAAIAATAATEAATAATPSPAVPTPPRPVPTLSEPEARPPQAAPLQADLDVVELLPSGELDEIATLMQLQPWRVSPPRQRATGPASSANHAALTAAIYDREAEVCAAAAQTTQAAAAAEPASQRSAVPPSASYDATESQLRVESAAALRAAWMYGLGPVESSAAMQTGTASLPLQHSPPHRMARSDHPGGDGGSSGGRPSAGASQPVAAAACGGAAHLGYGAGAAFGGGGDSVAGAFGDGGEATAAAAAAVAAACGAHGDASATFGGGAAAVLPAATAMATAAWFAQAQMPTQAQMQMPMQTLMQMPAQAQMQMPTQMQTQMLSPRPTQPSVITLLDEIQRGSAALAHVQSGISSSISGTFGGGASACSFGSGGGGCDSVSSVGHSVLHGGGLSIATAALGPPSDWLCSSPGAAASGAQCSGAAVGGSSCLSPGGAAAPGGAGGARAGAMLVQQRYRECEQMLGLLEAAVLQLDDRYRCGAALHSHPTPPPPPHTTHPHTHTSNCPISSAALV